MNLEISFGDTKNEKNVFAVSYKLNELDITAKWVKAFRDHFAAEPKIFGRGFFFGSMFYTSSQLVAEMRNTLDALRTHFPDYFASCPTPSDSIGRTELSVLHNYFEQLDQEPNWIPVVSIHDDVQPKAQWLNLLIHMYECLGTARDFFHIDLNFDRTLKWPIESGDFAEMSMTQEDGDLLISYGTTGVPPIHAFRCGPPAIPTFQTMYSCDLQLHFEGKIEFSQEAELNRWLREVHGIERINGVPSPGRFKIGQLAAGETKFGIKQKFESFQGLPFISGVRLTGMSERI